MIKIPKYVNGIFVGVFSVCSLVFFLKGNYFMSGVDLFLLFGNIAIMLDKE